ncbi:hypothetical protein KEJ19_05795 [Candidatus Bathyarchaeota archaeon]|nr:hypothetical protein [Candidatus Bathyarchaeota archaeon]
MKRIAHIEVDLQGTSILEERCSVPMSVQLDLRTALGEEALEKLQNSSLILINLEESPNSMSVFTFDGR